MKPRWLLSAALLLLPLVGAAQTAGVGTGGALVRTTDDPQAAQTASKLLNIKTGEPDPLLFKVPLAYTVRDTPPK